MIVSAAEFEKDFPFPCVAVGNPWPKITYYKDGVVVVLPHSSYIQTNTIYNQTTTISTFIIRSVKYADYGNWTCRAENTLAGGITGYDEKRTLFVVTCKCFISCFKPLMLLWLHNFESQNL